MFASKHGQNGRAYVLAFFLALITHNSHAFTVSPRQVNDAYWSNGSITAEVSAEALSPNHPARYTKLHPKYTSRRMAEMMRNSRQLNPGAAAVNAAFMAAALAAGYVVDDLTGQVTGPLNPTGMEKDHYVYTFYQVEGYYWGNSDLTQPASDGLRRWMKGSGYADDISDVELIWNGTQLKYRGRGRAVGSTEYSINKELEAGKTDCRRYSTWVGCLTPKDGIPLSDAQLDELLETALKDVTPQQLRDFFNTVLGNPEMFPELAEELQTWADELAAETGEASETKEKTDSTSPEDVQKVTIEDPIQIDETSVETKPNVEDGLKSIDDIFAPIRDYELPDLPLIPQPDLGIQSSASCETITFHWRNANVVFPNSSQCQKMQDMKDMMEWLLSVLTLFSCWYIILGQRSSPGA